MLDSLHLFFICYVKVEYVLSFSIGSGGGLQPLVYYDHACDCPSNDCGEKQKPAPVLGRVLDDGGELTSIMVCENSEKRIA